MSERSPGKALVRALRGRTVVEASCDAEGMDDVRLLLDDGRVVMIDAAAEEVDDLLAELGLGPQGRLVVKVGGRELWPFEGGGIPVTRMWTRSSDRLRIPDNPRSR